MSFLEEEGRDNRKEIHVGVILSHISLQIM